MPASIELETRPVSRLGLLGSDYRGIRCEPLCEPGEPVIAGQAVMCDARRPEICITAPATGRVSRIERGARRRLESLQIEIEASTDTTDVAAPAADDRGARRGFLLANGRWADLRTRPFGNIPDPAAEPAAILVTAMDVDSPLPVAEHLIEAFADEFSAAVDLLGRISNAPLYVCHAPGFKPRIESAAGVECRAFSGPYAGLPGRHIQAICPIGFAGGEVWHLGYQQAIAIGHLLVRRRPWGERLLVLGGDGVGNSRALLVPPGAAVDELLAGETIDGPTRILDGSPVLGRALRPDQGFVAANQDQLTVMRGSTGDEARVAGTLVPGDWLEAQAPPGIYAVPLLRALQVGDVDRARQLGALELVEEDLAPLTHACVSGADYGRLLRNVLDQLELGT